MTRERCEKRRRKEKLRWGSERLPKKYTCMKRAVEIKFTEVVKEEWAWYSRWQWVDQVRGIAMKIYKAKGDIEFVVSIETFLAYFYVSKFCYVMWLTVIDVIIVMAKRLWCTNELIWLIKGELSECYVSMNCNEMIGPF